MLCPLAQATFEPSIKLKKMPQNRCEQPAVRESQESCQCQSMTNSLNIPWREGSGQEQQFPRGKVITFDKKQGSLSGEQEFLTGDQGFLTGEQGFLKRVVIFLRTVVFKRRVVISNTTVMSDRKTVTADRRAWISERIGVPIK